MDEINLKLDLSIDKHTNYQSDFLNSKKPFAEPIYDVDSAFATLRNTFATFQQTLFRSNTRKETLHKFLPEEEQIALSLGNNREERRNIIDENMRGEIEEMRKRDHQEFRKHDIARREESKDVLKEQMGHPGKVIIENFEKVKNQELGGEGIDYLSRDSGKNNLKTSVATNWTMRPILKNNLKIFIGKLKKYGYLQNETMVSKRQTDFIDDKSYFGKIDVQKEAEKEKKRGKKSWRSIIKIFHPYSRKRLVWDIFHSIFIVFFLFYVPLSMTFANDFLRRDVTYTYVLLLMIDVFANFNTSYFKNGLEVKKRSLIARHYLKNGFISDFISIFGLVNDFQFSPNSLFPLKGFYFFKAYSLIQNYKKVTSAFQLNKRIKGTYDLAQLVLIIAFITHLIACMWAFVGDPKKDYNKDRTTWIHNRGLENEAWEVIYLYSYYWSVLTVMTVGYGDIVPQNIWEVICATIAISLGCIVFAYIISSVGDIVEEIQKDQIKFSEILDSINSYMTRKCINSDLQSRIREYLSFVWKESNNLNTEEEMKIINSLSSSLKEELLLESYKGFLQKTQVFAQNFSEKTMRKLVTIMKEVSLTPEDIIYSQNSNEEDPAIYFIVKGKVNLMSGNGIKSFPIKDLNEGDSFGEISFFTSMQRESSAISKDFVNLIMIKQSDFKRILHNSHDYEVFSQLKDRILINNDISFLPSCCPSCLKVTHSLDSCPKLHYMPNIERMIKSLNFPTLQLNRTYSYPRTLRRTPNSLKNRKANEERAIVLKKRANCILDSFFSIYEEDKNVERVSSFDFRDMESYTTFGSNEEEVGGKKDEAVGTRKEEINNNGPNPNIVGMLNRNLKSLHSSIDNRYETKKKEFGSSFEIVSDQKWKKGVGGVLGGKIFVFESNYNWKEYKPEGNLEEILRKWGKMKSIYHNIQRTKGQEERYRYFKYYCFYVNSILERFWAASKNQKKFYSMISCKTINFNSYNSKVYKPMEDQSPFKKRLAQIVGVNNLRNSSIEIPRSKLYDSIDEDQQ